VERLFAEDIAIVDEDSLETSYSLLASLYVCGERFLNRRLQDAIIKQILRLACIPDKDGVSWNPSAKAVNTVYHGTPQGSLGRHLMVDLHVFFGVEDWLNHGLEVDFIIDVARDLHDKVRDCDFHDESPKVENYVHPL
jgi:hypothetical protein